MFVLFALALLVCAGMWLAGTLLGPKNPTPEKAIPYECGNDTEGGHKIRVAAKFYLVAILFMVFDVEAALIYPWAVSFRGLGWVGLVSMTAFVGALLVALVYLWRKGALEWET
jgi:NADH-quinone oxidoreductase subunit A